MADTGAVETITLDVTNTPAGKMFVSSKDVPGLYLWGTDPEAVFADVIPIVKDLYRENRHLDVDVVQEPSSLRPIHAESAPRRFRVTIRGTVDLSAVAPRT